MRADRLLSILLLLQNERKLTTGELAGKLEVSRRTILRDMEALSMAGIPVYAERGRDGRWVLSKSFKTDLTGLKTEEFLSLLISAHPKLLADLGFKTHFDATTAVMEPAELRNMVIAETQSILSLYFK